jgi:hypothetical protein
MSESPPDTQIAEATRRVVGVAALRQIRRIVDTENAHEEQKSRWARRIGVVAIVAGIVIVAWAMHLYMR